jgi:hypothetical protein
MTMPPAASSCDTSPIWRPAAKRRRHLWTNFWHGAEAARSMRHFWQCWRGVETGGAMAEQAHVATDQEAGLIRGVEVTTACDASELIQISS